MQKNNKTPKVKMLIYTQSYPTLNDKYLAQFMKPFVNALTDKFDIKILCPLPWIPFIKNPNMTKELQGNVEIIKTKYFSIPFFTRWINPFLMRIGSAKVFFRIAHEWKPDIVSAHFIYPDVVAGVKLSKINSLPIISVIRNTPSIELEQSIYKCQWLNALKNSDSIICVSKAIKNNLSTYNFKKIDTIYNGIDFNVFNIGDAHKSKKEVNRIDSELIVCAARHNKIKGIDTLIKSASLLIKKRPNIKVEIIGQESEYTVQLLKLIRKYNLTSIVNIRGAIPQKELARWYNAADCVCLPTYNEGRPNALIEAQACGTKVVSTKIPGMIESVHPKTILVTPGNAEELAEAINITLSSKANRKELSNWAKQFTWEKTTKQYETVIKNELLKYRSK